MNGNAVAKRLISSYGSWTYKGASEAVIVAGAFGITLVEGFDFLTLSFAAPELMRTLDISREVIGLVFGVAVAGAVTGSLLLGLLAERIGKMTALAVALLLFGVCSFLMTSIGDVWALVLNRFVAGLGLGGVGPVAVALATHRIAENRRRELIGIVWSGIPTGAVLAGLVSYLFADTLGWNFIFTLGALLPLLSIALAFAVFGGQARLADTARWPAKAPRALWTPAYRPVLLLLCLLFILGYSSIALLLTWTPIVLRGLGFSNTVASLTASGVALWGALSSVFLGMMSARYPIYQVVIISFLLAFAGYCLMAISAGAYGTVALIVFAGGLSTGVQSSVVALTTTLLPAEVHSAALGTSLAAGRLSQIVAVAAIGPLIAHWGGWTLFIIVAAGSAVSAMTIVALPRVDGRSARRAA